MNYFELFEIPVQLRVDRKEAHAKFIELSKKHHPDYHAQSDDKAQAVALDTTADLNRALKTFQSPDETIKYVLQMKGLLEEEEKYELSPEFLMEVLEINDELMDADDKETRDRIEGAIDGLQNEIYEPVEEIVEHYQEGVTTEEELLQVKAYYYKKKYLDRIRRELAGKA